MRAGVAVETPGRNDEYFDLEDPAGSVRLEEPMTALGPLRGLVVIDEIQRRPDLFPVLRVLSDRRENPASFLILGSLSDLGVRREASRNQDHENF